MSKAARDNEGSERAGESQHYNNGVNSALREIDVLEAVWVFFGVRGHAASSAEVDSSPVQSSKIKGKSVNRIENTLCEL